MHLLIVLTVFTVRVRANLLQECAKLYNPGNYMAHLPSLKLPYLGDIPIPNNIPDIQPSPVAKTKAVKVVTTYIYKNPVCVKYSKKKTMCKQGAHKEGYDQLVTKEYFVRDRKGKSVSGNVRHRREFENDEDEEDNDQIGFYKPSPPGIIRANDQGNYLHTLETSEIKTHSKGTRKTPDLSRDNIENLLIEDRLDQLETILPHYTRRRLYETSTITVTKVLSNQRTMATLVVKNCIPYGYELCAPPARKRQSKVARPTSNSNEWYYFG